ncbi:hypothetical protein VE04_03113 [Pseudogymnoascus sp. 24MN13]|nr:hypothetical protein VE04_03113 [Pseudogymnoascus sp. 24MN13]
MELAYGIDELFDWPRQKRVLEECVENVKRTLENIPSELGPDARYVPGRFGHEPPHGGNSANDPHKHSTIHSPPLDDDTYLVEKYFNLLDAHEASLAAAASGQQRESTSHDSGRMISPIGTFLQPVPAPMDIPAESTSDAIATRMAAERETIVQDLLRVLGSISQVNMEPNGGSFLNKIRQIAATLLDTPRNHKGRLARQAEEYLGKFLDVLMRLEGGGRGEHATHIQALLLWSAGGLNVQEYEEVIADLKAEREREADLKT